MIFASSSDRDRDQIISSNISWVGWQVVVNYASSSGAAEEVAAQIKELGGDAIIVGADLGKKEDIDRSALPRCASTAPPFRCLHFLWGDLGVISDFFVIFYFILFFGLGGRRELRKTTFSMYCGVLQCVAARHVLQPGGRKQGGRNGRRICVAHALSGLLFYTGAGRIGPTQFPPGQKPNGLHDLCQGGEQSGTNYLSSSFGS